MLQPSALSFAAFSTSREMVAAFNFSSTAPFHRSPIPQQAVLDILYDFNDMSFVEFFEAFDYSGFAWRGNSEFQEDTNSKAICSTFKSSTWCIRV
jgi:hypothetical protein